MTTRNTKSIMSLVLLALVPGLLAQTYFFGLGVVMNLAVAVVTALVCEMLMLKLRNRSLKAGLDDNTGLVTAILLALALPPMTPIWVVIMGAASAIILAKHLYGGTGNNLFNPAMVGYAVIILSFPLAMSQWQTPSEPGSHAAIMDILAMKLGAIWPDGITSATPLDSYRFRGAMSNHEFWQVTEPGIIGAYAWDWINLAYLGGGLMLLRLRLIRWHAPMMMLLTMSVLAILFYDDGSSASLGSPLFHLFSGATMMAAFFIVTDPVTSPDTTTGQLIFGAGVGLLIFIIRSIGGYPDGIAFAILLMNAATPLIDQSVFYLRRINSANREGST